MNRFRVKGVARLCLAMLAMGSLTPWSASGDTQEANVSGKWSGSFVITMPDGTVQPDTAFFILRQDRNTITGTAGGNENQQSEIKDGKVAGSEVQFTLEKPGQMHLVFDLHLSGDHLKGAASGDMRGQKVRIEVDTTRVSIQSKQISSPSQKLYEEISHMDSVLFNAFNDRDLRTLETLFTDDLEFYHDRDGLTSYQQNMESFKRHFGSDTRVRRQLVEGSLEVYPIKGYGAVEVGIHRFYSSERGQPEQLTATAKFMHVWRHTNEGWKISRVISYDHR
ncbi:MAG TPA: nuclear transport factor 2 family protein [Terriglobales bacterium]|nr:nuclear transport factor 2 family protein [Terriglobales bacterium]